MIWPISNCRNECYFFFCLPIATNVYNSVKAPAKRGFSYIEIWMIGVQIPIPLGILEYAILLALKKYFEDLIKARNVVLVSLNLGNGLKKLS